MFLTDHKVCLKHEKEQAEEEIEKVKEKGFKIVPVGIGPHIGIQGLERINKGRSNVKCFGEYANPEIVGKNILHGMLLFGIIKHRILLGQDVLGAEWGNIE